MTVTVGKFVSIPSNCFKIRMKHEYWTVINQIKKSSSLQNAGFTFERNNYSDKFRSNTGAFKRRLIADTTDIKQFLTFSAATSAVIAEALKKKKKKGKSHAATLVIWNAFRCSSEISLLRKGGRNSKKEMF